MERFRASNRNQRLSSPHHHQCQQCGGGGRRRRWGGVGRNQAVPANFVCTRVPSYTHASSDFCYIGAQLNMAYIITWRLSCKVNFTKKISELPHRVLRNCVVGRGLPCQPPNFMKILYINCLLPIFKIFDKSKFKSFTIVGRYLVQCCDCTLHCSLQCYVTAVMLDLSNTNVAHISLHVTSQFIIFKCVV